MANLYTLGAACVTCFRGTKANYVTSCVFDGKEAIEGSRSVQAHPVESAQGDEKRRSRETAASGLERLSRRATAAAYDDRHERRTYLLIAEYQLFIDSIVIVCLPSVQCWGSEEGLLVFIADTVRIPEVPN